MAGAFVSVESTTCFNFSNLVDKIKKSIIKRYPDLKGKAFDELMYKSLKTFSLNNQAFDYEKSENYFGGCRWYVRCPKCNNPALRLYLPTAYKDREQRYLCKDCHKLKYASVILGASKRYEKVVKPLKQLERLRAQLLKKGITPIKAKPILEDYERIEKELASSPEYRLWRFQKEHGMQL